MADEGRKIKADDIGKGFYHLKRTLDGMEENVVIGDLYYMGKRESVFTGETYLSFLQAVKDSSKIVSMLLYNTPEENLLSVKGDEIHLKTRDGSAREYQRGTKKYNELKKEYEEAVAQREKESSKLIDKLNRESREQ